MDSQATDEEVDWGDPGEITESRRRGLAAAAAGRVISAEAFYAQCAQLCAEFGIDLENLPPDERDERLSV